MNKFGKKLKPLGGPRDPRHGTVNAYVYWGCRCEKCTDANREYGAELRAATMANLSDEDHGKLSVYNAGCRCEKCKDALRATLPKRRNRYHDSQKIKALKKVNLSELA